MADKKKPWNDKEEGRKPWDPEPSKPLDPNAIRAAAKERKPPSAQDDIDDQAETIKKRNKKFAILGGQRPAE